MGLPICSGYTCNESPVDNEVTLYNMMQQMNSSIYWGLNNCIGSSPATNGLITISIFNDEALAKV